MGQYWLKTLGSGSGEVIRDFMTKKVCLFKYMKLMSLSAK